MLSDGSVHRYTHTHTRIHIYTHTRIHAYTYTHACTCIHTYTHTQIHTFTHTHIHTYTQTRIHLHTHLYTHLYHTHAAPRMRGVHSMILFECVHAVFLFLKNGCTETKQQSFLCLSAGVDMMAMARYVVGCRYTCRWNVFNMLPSVEK